jgi:hypothetical protein
MTYHFFIAAGVAILLAAYIIRKRLKELCKNGNEPLEKPVAFTISVQKDTKSEDGEKRKRGRPKGSKTLKRRHSRTASRHPKRPGLD